MMYENGGLDETDDETDPEFRPTAQGIAQCLIMLAEEAAELGLPHTIAALRRVARICQLESQRAEQPTPAPTTATAPRHTRH